MDEIQPDRASDFPRGTRIIREVAQLLVSIVLLMNLQSDRRRDAVL